ncbi:SDR family NAD(P)-dependent oxidoreductase, partial [Acidianus sp. RZ1]
MIALVTGASKGIGKATVSLLKREGYTVIAISRTKPDSGDENYALDVADKGKVLLFVKDIISKYKDI